VRRVGLVSPYRDDVQAKIVANWGRSGYDCTAERHVGLQDNFSFAEVDENTISRLVRDVAKQGCDAVAIVCTNMRGAAVAETLEAELGLPVYDSVAITLWKSLLVAGVDPAPVRGWGSLFQKLRTSQAPARPSAVTAT
jgi:maleate isomerase